MSNPLVDVLVGIASSGSPWALAEQVRRWVERFVDEAPRSFGRQMRKREACGYGGGRGCGKLALGVCIRCGRGACLGHAFVSERAELICYRCSGKAARIEEPLVPKDRALAVLGLEPSASFAEARARFRELSTVLHPDRFQREKDKSVAERMYKAVTSAYHVLEKLERKAA